MLHSQDKNTSIYLPFKSETAERYWDYQITESESTRKSRQVAVANTMGLCNNFSFAFHALIQIP